MRKYLLNGLKMGKHNAAPDEIGKTNTTKAVISTNQVQQEIKKRIGVRYNQSDVLTLVGTIFNRIMQRIYHTVSSTTINNYRQLNKRTPCHRLENFRPTKMAAGNIFDNGSTTSI